MPELPEVEVLKRQLAEKMTGLTVSKFHIVQTALFQTPPAQAQKNIPGQKIMSVKRRGKFLQILFENESMLWLHLGMTGRLIWGGNESRSRYLQIKFEFKESKIPLSFYDIRKFGNLYLTGLSGKSIPPNLQALGTEPFDLTPEKFTALFKGRTGLIKSLLLNQHLVAGLGNIYADESLFRAKIHPRKRPFRLKSETLKGLYAAICETLREAIERGGSSIDDFMHTDGRPGSFQKFHQVYGREGKKCTRCQSLIKRIILSNRSAHFCPVCQR